MSTGQDPNCLFCRIASGEIPAQVLHRTETVTAFADIQPQAPTHWLLIPNRHTASVADTSDNIVLGDLLGAARDLASQHGLTAYRLVMNTGAEAGQSVFHLHVHLLAGRELGWPPG